MPRSLTMALVCLFSVPAVAAPPALTVCKKLEVTATANRQGDAKAREAAHKGFTYLAAASIEWTRAHNCFGCHVQAVTMEALTAARHHQYDVDPKDIAAMVQALSMGITAGGHATGVAFQGAAWARYDKYMSTFGFLRGKDSADPASRFFGVAVLPSEGEPSEELRKRIAFRVRQMSSLA